MASTKSVLRERAGVTLTEVTLTNGGGTPLAVAYSVTSRRTPEVRTSHTLVTAEQHFAEEVARSEKPGPTRSARA